MVPVVVTEMVAAKANQESQANQVKETAKVMEKEPASVQVTAMVQVMVTVQVMVAAMVMATVMVTVMATVTATVMATVMDLAPDQDQVVLISASQTGHLNGNSIICSVSLTLWPPLIATVKFTLAHLALIN